jgi:hypothetical protein
MYIYVSSKNHLNIVFQEKSSIFWRKLLKVLIITLKPTYSRICSFC